MIVKHFDQARFLLH